MRKNFNLEISGKDHLLNVVKNPFSLLNLKELSLMKRRLVSNYSESEIRSLRIDINARYQRYVNFNAFGIFLTVLFTGSFTMLSSYAIASFNFGLSLITDFFKGSYERQDKDQIKNSFEELLKKDFEEQGVQEVIKTVVANNLGSYFQLLGFALLFVLILIIYYYFRFSKIAKLKFLLDEALDEKIQYNKMNNADNNMFSLLKQNSS
jgi:hypothetical protein